MSAPAAVLGLLAGLLHDLHPATYDPAQHPVDPAAARDAERLLTALHEHGMTISTTRTPAPTHITNVLGRTNFVLA